MRTIGMIGGMSWESSREYYRLVNEGVKGRLGGLHSADCLMYSLDFAEIEALQVSGQWDAAAQLMIAAAQRLEKGGADCIVICTNTMHRMAGDIAAAVDLPLIHIADATADAIKARELTRIGLLGTIFTMEQDFYRGRLEAQHGLEVRVPDAAARQAVNRIIYEELVLGVLKDESRAVYVDIIQQLAADGAQGVILGCTEIGLLIKPQDSPLPVFDTTTLHAQAAVAFALTDPN